MKRDYVGLLTSEIANLAIAIRDVSMRCAVEAVAPNLVATIELIGDRVEVTALGQRLMKRRIEDCYLRKPGSEKMSRGLNALDVRGIVQRRQLDAVFDASHDFVGDQHRVSKTLSSVNDAMSGGVNVGDAVYAVDAGGFGSRPSNYEIHCRAHIAKRFREALLLPAFDLESDDRFAADPFDRAAREPFVLIGCDKVEISGNELKFDG